MKDKGLLEELGNPLAVEEYLVYEHFSKTPESELAYYESLFVTFNKEIYGYENLPTLQKTIFNKVINGTKRRVETMANIIKPAAGDLILDGGCGIGAISFRVMRLGAKCVGFDMNLTILKYSMAIAKRNGIKINLVNADARYIPFKNSVFNKIIFADVFEHINEKDKVLNEILRLLNNKGATFIHTDNESRVKLGVFIRRIQQVLLLQNPFKWSAAFSGREGGHTGVIAPNKLMALAKGSGFSQADLYFDGILPLGFHRALFGYTLTAVKADAECRRADNWWDKT